MFKSTDVILALGRRGCGKTFLSRTVQAMYPRVVIFDTLHEYSDEPDTVYNFEEFSKRILELANTEKFRLVFQFDAESTNRDLAFDHALRVLYYMGNVQVVIEEIQMFSSPHFLPHYLRESLLTGRHRNMSLLFTTQRPGELNKTIVSQCNHIFAGQLHEKNDLSYVSGFLGTSSEKLTTLKDRTFLYFRPGQSIITVSNTLSASTTVSEPAASPEIESPEEKTL